MRTSTPILGPPCIAATHAHEAAKIGERIDAARLQAITPVHQKFQAALALNP